jgi:hypothetical protein
MHCGLVFLINILSIWRIGVYGIDSNTSNRKPSCIVDWYSLLTFYPYGESGRMASDDQWDMASGKVSNGCGK